MKQFKTISLSLPDNAIHIKSDNNVKFRHIKNLLINTIFIGSFLNFATMKLSRVFLITLILFPISCNYLSDGTDNKSENMSKDVKASTIIASLDSGQNVYYEDKIIWDDLDFTELKNRNKISGKKNKVFVTGSVTFINCVFMNEVKAYNDSKGVYVTSFSRNLSFVGCDFQNSADFTESVVHEDLFVSGCTFRQNFNMRGMRSAHKKACFDNNVFEKEVDFKNSVFGEVDFKHSEFNHSADFQNSVFGSIDFGHSEFKQFAGFQKCIARSMFFGNVKFDGYADFAYISVDNAVFNYSVFADKVDFSHSHFDNRFESTNVVFGSKPLSDNMTITGRLFVSAI